MTAHLSTLRLHQYRYGELQDGEDTAVRAHLDACAVCRERLGAQEDERAAFALAPIPDAILQAAEADAPRTAGWLSRWLRPTLLAAAAAAAVLLSVVALQPTSETVETTRTKGVLGDVEIWIESDAGPRPLREDEALHTGSRVQILYNPHGAAWAALAGRDGTGTLEVYGSFEPLPVGLQPTPFALTLDDAPGPQEFFVVTSEAELAPERVKELALAGVDTEAISVHRISADKED